MDEVLNEEEKCIYQKSYFEDKEEFMTNLSIIIQDSTAQDSLKALARLGSIVISHLFL